MKLQKKNLVFLVLSIVLSLAGLVALQFVLIANAIELKQQTFRQNVNAAMNAIVQKLETGEAVRNVYRVAVKKPNTKFNMQMYSVTNDSMVTLSVTDDTLAMSNSLFVASGSVPMKTMSIAEPPIRWNGQTMSYTLTSPQHVLIRAFDQNTGKDTIIVDRFTTAGKHSVDLDGKAFSRGKFLFKFFCDSSSYTMEMQNGSTQLVTKDGDGSLPRQELIGRVVDKLFFNEHIPIEQRLNRTMLDTAISNGLRQSGIDLPFAYGIISDRDDSVRLVQPATYSHNLQTSEFKARLFPSDISFNLNHLALFFPDQEVYILKQLGPQLGLTFLFMGVIVYCFMYTIRTIVRQKEFSLRLMDFVNNMTHEFKTPISTISVAVETMTHPDIVRDEEKIRRYGSVIQDENTRMRHQVDKILQMAVLEEGKYSLKSSPVDIHEIISKAVENIALQIETKGGKVTYDPGAERPMVNGDVVHLTNIINNILDNASKYSGGRPEIVIATTNTNGSIRIAISDNGIGISREDLQHVFEKYFRVHTGNVHNVKGFGLGLSYVKLMTEAHGGSITLSSELAKGTTVELLFPVVPQV